jgi:predicted HTH transcriptional regulator
MPLHISKRSLEWLICQAIEDGAEDRIEITNPGEPLVDPQRFVDSPPKSRNEVLASLMRRFRICEERGSGIDKVISEAARKLMKYAPYWA